jgi:hypothetical protein
MKRALVLLVLLATLPAALPAQHVDFTPRIGVFVPVVNLTEGSDPGSGLPVAQKAATAFTIGGRLGWWWGSASGVEGVVDYNKGSVQSYFNGSRLAGNLDSHFFGASIRPMFRINSPSGKLAMIVSAGGGLVDRGGVYINGVSPPLTQYTGRTDPAGAAGLAFLLNVSRHVAARIDVDGYTYEAQYRSPGGVNTSSLRQYDLVITFGLTGSFRDRYPGEN